VYAGADGWIEAPGFAVDAVNSIGAGDVFDIGYLFARRMGWAPLQRIQFACALAALVVSQPGQRTYPNAATVLAFLRQHCSDPAWQTISE
jgi:ribokinase